MEWVVLLALALVAAALVAPPAAGRAAPADEAAGATRLAVEHGRLLAELRELDEDAAAGRISPDDRTEGRRALAPRLRAVTEARRALGGREAAG